MDYSREGTQDRLQREEESRLFLETNGVYAYLFGAGHYRKIDDPDLQNWGQDIQYYLDLFRYVAIDEKERLGNKSYFALRTSGIGATKGLTPRVFCSRRQRNHYWFSFRTVHMYGKIVFAEGYLLNVEKLRKEVEKETGKDIDTIYDWSNKLRSVTDNEREMKLSKDSNICIYCNRKVEEEYVEIRLPETFLQKVCDKHIKVKEGGVIEEV